ncbi:MAG: hypothetical protein V1754_11785 [Pseudomonadota bacterium]
MQPTNSERRQHKVYLTKNTEYHCRERECVGVRDRKTGEWSRWHKALRTKLVGGINGEKKLFPQPVPGFRLLFAGGDSLLTSKLQLVRRPERESLPRYISMAKSGIIQNA